ncbi:competence/damage-inducible protein CinA, putative [Talaromyces stipitatus ATCC 10500]|uniref:Competence/damage-inducible protein CinA, putative n=1 Tax=Talaromyces stipitatus (strain ATCC 10500 / CBS 375.48 / QM 6759 / NRRL 1006) TaxID=441959 RepID=B8M1B9_TALSN|nr:competence/damage-inducible protein CinA, putative [Talaromyces stipitatus ATCC 10500]EED21815.1 competence/damage-inducible protein CinA, putative [Talaromyces stipitatus ATCC 10500]
MSTFPPSSLRPLLEEISSLLKERKETISVAETAAGGIISASLLSIPGASAYFKGGLTLYTLESRIAFADWTPELITNYKGPTTGIVAGLAESTRSKLQSTYTISESGTAGPGGGKGSRKPGVVFVAVAAPSGSYTREVDTGYGEDREKNMVGFAEEGLKLLRDVIKGDAKL